ncbi:hypothetical protein ACMAUO_00695 [Gluconacetobacter sp. Hr-1-5]
MTTIAAKPATAGESGTRRLPDRHTLVIHDPLPVPTPDGAW